jgi:hypothetical protein
MMEGTKTSIAGNFAHVEGQGKAGGRKAPRDLVKVIEGKR